MIKYVLIALLYLGTITLLKGEGKSNSNLIVKTHVYNDGVAIRWTPVNLYLWRKWSHEGYRIERTTIARNGVALKNGESLLLGGKSILPLKEDEWKEYENKVPEAGLIRYCLYHDSSRLSKNKEAFFSEMEEADQCYIFSMLAMQSRFELAIASGIGFVDNSTNIDEIYLYKLYPVGSTDRDTQVFVINMQEETVLPAIANFNAGLKDNRVLLEWDSRFYNNLYFGYFIERSLDSGKSYHLLNKTPFIPVKVEGGHKQKNEIYLDTIAGFNIRILYRITGVSYFGQNGIPSENAGIVAFPETDAFPGFVECELNGNNGSLLKWQFDKEKEALIKGFKILLSDSVEGTFMEVDTILISRDVRSFELHTDKSVCYVRIAVVTMNSNFNPSLPVMVQQVDSVPPMPPRLLSLSVDTSGVALLSWKHNTENDFMAYLVFKGNDRNLEFSSITPHYLTDSFIRDTLYTNMLRDSIYYKVIALDNRYNESKYSSVIAFAIPNKIPPAPAYIHTIRKDNKKVRIQWYKSNSNDVAFYNLIKERTRVGEIEKIKIDKDSSGYVDSLVVPGESYRYTIQAIDLIGLKSKVANPYEVKIPLEMIMPKVPITLILNDTVNNYMTFYWSYGYENEVKHYRIVQVNEDGSSQSLGTSQSDETYFNYYYLKPYTMKTYYIVAYFKDGRRSQI